MNNEEEKKKKDNLEKYEAKIVKDEKVTKEWDQKGNERKKI